MKSFLYLCIITVIVSTYSIPVDSEYIGILIKFLSNYIFILTSKHSQVNEELISDDEEIEII